jgi:hypothetical protein
MTKFIAVLISAIFYFGITDELAFEIKKAALMKVHKGLPTLSSFAKKLYQEKLK